MFKGARVTYGEKRPEAAKNLDHPCPVIATKDGK